ncbi:fas apoptotic inhibitory molecule 1 [Crotalus adamanteus]
MYHDSPLSPPGPPPASGCSGLLSRVFPGPPFPQRRLLSRCLFLLGERQGRELPRPLKAGSQAEVEPPLGLAFSLHLLVPGLFASRWAREGGGEEERLLADVHFLGVSHSREQRLTENTRCDEEGSPGGGEPLKAMWPERKARKGTKRSAGGALRGVSRGGAREKPGVGRDEEALGRAAESPGRVSRPGPARVRACCQGRRDAPTALSRRRAGFPFLGRTAILRVAGSQKREKPRGRRSGVSWGKGRSRSPLGCPRPSLLGLGDALSSPEAAGPSSHPDQASLWTGRREALSLSYIDRMTDLVAVWEVGLSDGVHKIEFEHGTTSGKRVVYVDGKEIIRKEWMFKLVGKETFTVGAANTKATINIDAVSGFAYEYTLEIDGKSLKKYLENRSKTTNTWVLHLDGTDFRVVLEKDTMDVWCNGKKVETAGEFVEDGTETHFSIGKHNCYIKAISSGKRREGILHMLIVDDGEIPEVLE